MAELREQEVTYLVAPDWAVPDLAPALDSGCRLEVCEHRLEATYLDTAEQTLRWLGVTLRHRQGGDDAGWHLKIPAGEARTELQHRSDDSRPPAVLLDRLRGVIEGDDLQPVATVVTHRVAHRILSPLGQLVVEVADDRVEGADVASSETTAWREVETELGPAGDEKALDRLGKLLTESGADRRGTTLKLDRVRGPLDGGGDDSLSAYLRAHCRAALLGEIGLRGTIDVDGIHDTRVAIRRIRSVLRLFAPLLEDRAIAADDELRWFAGLFSDIRDADVMRAHLQRKVASLPPDRVFGPVRQEIEDAIAGDRDRGIDRWREAGAGARYRLVTALLATWLRSPPLRARPLSDDELRRRGAKILRKARRKVRRRLASAGDDPVRVHAARKATKRLRYAADLLTPVIPEAAVLAERAKELQTVLGDHQDLVVEAAFLRYLAARYGARPEHNGFTYGLLMASAEGEAAEIRERLGRI
ncbi:MAG: CYTH and CHAD domain-containing protein [Nocardioides sp.]|nr:CYTH and CHAD domain-containing protein [Nocardioides sp.]